MAITAAQQTSILKIVAGLFNAAPGATYLTSFANYMALPGATSLGLANALAADAAFTNGVMGGQVTVAAQVAKLMANFGLTYAAAPVAGTADGDAQAFFTGQINAGVGFGQIVDSAVTFLDGISAKQAAGTALTAAETIYATTAQTLQNKALVAEHYSATLGTASGTLASLQTVLSGVTATTFAAGATSATVTAAQLSAALTAGGGVAGTTYTLTTGVDAIVGSANNDTINATVTNTFNPLDSVDGGLGLDTLNVLDNVAAVATAGRTVMGVETANLGSALAVTADTTAWTGLTALNVTGDTGNSAVTVAATTAVTVANHAGGTLAVAGGLSQTVTATGGNTTLSGSVGAVTLTNTAQAATAISVNGGTSVTVTATGATTAAGTITIGNTAAPTGAVVVTTSTDAATGAHTSGAIAVTGGTTVAITSNLLGLVNTLQTSGTIGVTGTAATTTVSVTQTAAVAAAAAVTGVVNGAVTISDVNNASLTLANTISSVTLNNYGAASAINSNALTTLSLSGTAGTLTVTDAATVKQTALALTVNGLSGTNTLTLTNNQLATLNVTAGATASTLANIVNGTVTTMNVAGAGALTLTSIAGLTGLTAVNAATNTGGVTLGSALLTTTAFTGGTGNDSVIVAATHTKAIAMGTGNDTVALAGALGVGGSIDGGLAGNDTLVLDAAAFALTGVTGFETLSLGANATGAYDATGFTALSTNATVAATTFNSVAANAGLTLNGVNGLVTYNLANSAGTTDVLALSLVGAATGANSVTAAGIETVNITASNSTAVAIVQTLTLSAAAATTVTVTGGALTSVVLVNTDTTITSLNASAVAGGNFTWTTGALAAASTITGSATGINTVTIAVGSLSNTYVGGAGNDLITSNNIVANTVTLGNGANSYTHAGAGVQTVTGGTGVDTITTGTGNDVIVGGGGADQITGGAGADSITITGTTSNIIQAAGASGTNTSTTIQTSELTSTFDVVRGAVAGDTITTANAAIVTAGLTTAGTNLAAGAADTAVFARGTYDAVNGTFSFGAAGLDTALTYDANAAAGAQAETIILVGFVSGASTAVGGVITLV